MSNEIARETAERTTAVGAVEKTAETVVMGISSHVSGLNSAAAEVEKRLGNLKYRLLDITDNSEAAVEAPEPVRQEIDELKYQLSNLDGMLSIILQHVGDLERL